MTNEEIMLEISRGILPAAEACSSPGRTMHLICVGVQVSPRGVTPLVVTSTCGNEPLMLSLAVEALGRCIAQVLNDKEKLRAAN